MAFAGSEKWSPFLEHWEFEDEVGIVLDVGRFVVPNTIDEDVGSRMSETIVNDGRRAVCRTETFYGVDSLVIKFAFIPYNKMIEFRNRVGVRFKIKNYLGEYLWAVLRSASPKPLHMHITLRSEQRYNLTLEFAQVSPI